MPVNQLDQKQTNAATLTIVNNKGSILEIRNKS